MWQAPKRLTGDWVRDGVFSLLLWVWFSLLLLPFLTAAKFTEPQTIVLYVGMIVAVQWGVPLGAVRALTSLLVLGIEIHHFYYKFLPFWRETWLLNVWGIFRRSFQEWVHLPGGGQDGVVVTVGFLALLAAGVYLVRMALPKFKWILILWIIGMIGIGVEDTFGPIEAHFYMIGFFSLGSCC